jgi:hypothetical protein
MEEEEGTKAHRPTTTSGVAIRKFSAGAILDRFLHHAQTIAITGRSYRLKDHAAIAGKEDKNKKAKSKSNETLAAEPAS